MLGMVSKIREPQKDLDLEMVGGCWMVAHVCRKTQLDLGGGVSCASRGSGFTGLEGRNGGKGGCGIGEGC